MSERIKYSSDQSKTCVAESTPAAQWGRNDGTQLVASHSLQQVASVVLRLPQVIKLKYL
jgi:hypothetical protein